MKCKHVEMYQHKYQLKTCKVLRVVNSLPQNKYPTNTCFYFIASMVFLESVDTSIYKVQFNNIQHADNNNIDQLKV